jgi:nitroimidazol reductase NimA-like FMN-containing flavoprotein (pyridoxamine 5'-phosphate oxidase superfamily)
VSSTDPRPAAVRDALAANWFCTLATTSPEQRPHVAGVLYALVGRDLYVHTDRSSRKARNIVANPNVAVCVPVAASPGTPPNTVSLQGTAALLELDDLQVARLLANGSLAAITSHGELDRPDTCFVRITPGRHAAAYGVGVSEQEMATDQLSAFGRVAW